MINVCHSGALGDIVYSLNILKNLYTGEKYNYYLKNILSEDNINYYDMASPLIESQDFINKVIPFSSSTPLYEYPSGVNIHINLDLFRLKLEYWQNHLIKMYYLSLDKEIPKNWKDPWLNVEAKRITKDPYVIVQKTSRYNNPKVDWCKKIEELKEIYKENVYFIGLEAEYNKFKVYEIKYFKPENLLDIAKVIKGSDKCYVNQSVCLTLCQSLGVEYELELEPKHVNLVRLFYKNESIIKETL